MKTLVPYEPHLQRFPRQNMAFFSFTANYHILKTTPPETSVGLMIQE